MMSREPYNASTTSRLSQQHDRMAPGGRLYSEMPMPRGSLTYQPATTSTDGGQGMLDTADTPHEYNKTYYFDEVPDPATVNFYMNGLLMLKGVEYLVGENYISISVSGSQQYAVDFIESWAPGPV